MMIVRCILVEMTVPLRIRPRMETIPVKGHFLSGEHNCQIPSMQSAGRFLRTTSDFTSFDSVLTDV